MARIAEPELDAVRDLNRRVVRMHAEEPQRPLCVLGCVERLDPFALGGAASVLALRVASGQVRAVCEQDPRQVAARSRRMDRTAETATLQQRQTAAVIDMRVAQDDRVDASGVEWKLAAVTQIGAFAALDQTAVEQQRRTADTQNMAGAGDLTGRSEELELHWTLPFSGTPRCRW